MIDLEQWMEECRLSFNGITMEDIYGQKFWIPVLRGFVSHPEIDDLFDIQNMNGILLTGKEGVGKTILTQSFLGELEDQGYKVLYIKGRKFLEPEEETGRKLERLTEECRTGGKVALALEDMDELEHMDTLAFKLGEAIESLKMENVSVIWIFTTEKEKNIPAPLKKELCICPLSCPTDEERKEYLEQNIYKFMAKNPEFHIDDMVEITEGLTFEELERLILFLKTQIKAMALKMYGDNYQLIRLQIQERAIVIGKNKFLQALEQVKYKEKNIVEDKIVYSIPVVHSQAGIVGENVSAESSTQNKQINNSSPQADSHQDLVADSMPMEDMIKYMDENK